MTVREEAIALRLQGLSYNEIRQQLPVAKSSLSEWLRGIPLAKHQVERLRQKVADNGKRSVARITTEQRRQGGLRVQELHGSRLHRFDENSWQAGGLAYRKDEIPIKERVERFFGQTFSKEIIGRKIFDFASDSLLIEYTEDWRTGVSEAIERLQGVTDDPRTRVLIADLDRLGPKRLARCDGLVLMNVKNWDARV